SVQRAGHPQSTTPAESPGPARTEGPAETLLAELTRAADGADQIAKGADRAHDEVAAILDDPVGHRALNRLLITPETVRANPALLQSFAVYITPASISPRQTAFSRTRPWIRWKPSGGDSRSIWASTTEFM